MMLDNLTGSEMQCMMHLDSGGGRGGQQPGSNGEGSVQEAGEERAGGRISDGAGAETNRK